MKPTFAASHASIPRSELTIGDLLSFTAFWPRCSLRAFRTVGRQLGNNDSREAAPNEGQSELRHSRIKPQTFMILLKSLQDLL